MSSSPSELLPAGADVSFNEIGEAMALGTCQEAAPRPCARWSRRSSSSVPTERLGAAAEALQALGDAGTVRGILISEGDNPAPPARVAGNTVALHGLKPAYLNNAVAALRLSSLPTLVWWRGGRPETLDGLAELADRIVLDDDAPEPIWARATTLFEDTAFSDLRWARLTQWRALMAHFFDIPEVLAAAADFHASTIAASDRMAARLFAAWLRSSIAFRDGFAVRIRRRGPGYADRGESGSATMSRSSSSVWRLRNVSRDRGLRRGHRSASRMVSVTDQSLTGLLTEELRIRARDAAFERALAHFASAA